MRPLRYSAFSADPAGGNPAGVVLDASGMDEAEMHAVAGELGYSETAFLFPGDVIRYFSPLAEVPFCGHATIATAVAHARSHGPGTLVLSTRAGEVPVTTALDATGAVTATLTSVAPRSQPLTDLPALLSALRWPAADLDPALPAALAYAGAWHPIIAAATRTRLAELDYDYPALSALMAERGWTTVNLVYRESASVFHSRNPFPPGGVVEDPATGAAAAALGGYLRERALAAGEITVHQGVDMGRPALITVGIPAEGGISVSGTAVEIG
ncbi:PhzF family phenazine biosynthesis protein [Actinokineospora guangxiensis]|uniref:PhzF family phenazine biosynthesis protein n=1 Tax=Actinokineospora guangxiensis TaxID=1490288 RepID=A0ABW0ERP6_9PSEU